MSHVIPNLEHFFESFLRTLHEAIEGLNGQCEPNRANTLLCRLRDFEITLGLISSRLASTGSSEQVLGDIDELTRALRSLQATYLSRYNDQSATEPRNEPLFELDCPVEYTGQAGRPRYSVDKDLVERLRKESFKWVDIAKILGVSSKTLIRRRNEFEMPIGPDAYTRIEDCDLDGHVRDILRQNPEAGNSVAKLKNFALNSNRMTMVIFVRSEKHARI